VWHFSGEMFATSYFCGHVLLAFTWKILMVSVVYLSYNIMPDTIQYCITLPYSIFFCWFFVVLYHTHTQYVGEMYVMIKILGYERRRDVEDVVE
jgi:hypothetical protein